MKKIFFRIIITLLVLAAAYIIFNQFDIGEVTTEFTGMTAEEYFAKLDYSKDNDFYRLLSLTDYKDVDIESDEVYMKYRKLIDPAYDVKEINTKSKKWYFTSLTSITLKFDKEIFDQLAINSHHWCKKISENRKDILKLKDLSSIYIKRYQKLINSKVYSDIMITKNLYFNQKDNTHNTISRYITGKLISWMRISQIYNALCASDALNGNWDEAIKKLVSHVNFLRRTMKTNKGILIQILNKMILKTTLVSLNSLLNEKDCPKYLFDYVITMPDLTYEEFGNKNAIIGEMILPGIIRNFQEVKTREFNNIFYTLFYQPNRTLNRYIKSIKKILLFDKTPPYLWQEKFEFSLDKKKGLFWWVQNPIGKAILIHSSTNFKRLIADGYILKSTFDILKISAELRSKFNGDRSAMALLKTLKTYRSLMDPCSGASYKWNDKKQLMYSIGVDKIDNKGKYVNINVLENDYTLPIILYVK